jgi:hypothetical protein
MSGKARDILWNLSKFEMVLNPANSNVRVIRFIIVPIMVDLITKSLLISNPSIRRLTDRSDAKE